MGKRSNFERRRTDFYPTSRAAVVPLIPYLRRGGIRTFVEPCCGEGDLARHLESFGLCCLFAGDIRTTGQERSHSTITAAPTQALRPRRSPVFLERQLKKSARNRV